MADPARKPPIPSVRARRAGELLKEFRERAGVSQHDVAEWVGVTQAAVSHYESARRLVGLEEAERLLELYEVPAADREVVLALIRDASKHGWWMHYADVTGGPFAELEDSAKRIDLWDDRIVPGLFQTQPYARAVIGARGLYDCEQIERKLRFRGNRQQLVTRMGAPQINVVLDEAILDRPIGGAEAFRDQLHRLALDAQLPNVDLRILPKSVGAHPGLDGPFIVLRFSEPFKDVAYVEGMHGATYLEGPSRIAECSVAFEGLLALALTQKETVQLLEAASRK